MRKRLIGWFLLLIAVTVVSMGWRINNTAGATFRAFRQSHTRAHLSGLPQLLSQHYVDHGNWDGITAEVENVSRLLNMDVTLIDNQSIIRATTHSAQLGTQMSDISWAEEVVPLLDVEQEVLVGYLLMARNQQLYEADDLFFQELLTSSFLTAVFVGLVAAALAIAVSHSIVTPLRHMVAATRSIVSGDYDVRVVEHERDEIGRLGQAINQMAGEIGALERVRRDLVMNVSHDFSTPLTVINGYLEALQSGKIADRRTAEQAFDHMKTEVDNLRILIDSLNEVAALDSGQIPLNLVATDLVVLVKQSMERVSWSAASKNIAVDLIKEPSEPIIISLDPEKIGQVLFNLLDNGIHYTPVGGRIDIAVEESEAAVSVSIADNGEGILPKHIPFIFERFYRAGESENREVDGYGMGLSIVQSITRRHGGEVLVTSDGAHKGARFTLTIPKTPPLENL